MEVPPNVVFVEPKMETNTTTLLQMEANTTTLLQMEASPRSRRHAPKKMDPNFVDPLIYRTKRKSLELVNENGAKKHKEDSPVKAAPVETPKTPPTESNDVKVETSEPANKPQPITTPKSVKQETQKTNKTPQANKRERTKSSENSHAKDFSRAKPLKAQNLIRAPKAKNLVVKKNSKESTKDEEFPNCRRDDCMRKMACSLAISPNCEYKSSIRWYHWSYGEHYCNFCFEAVYRRDRELIAEMESWQTQWDLRAGFRSSLRVFIGDRLLPFWLLCNSCRKWRPVNRKVPLTPEAISSFQCGQLTPHSHPAMKPQETCKRAESQCVKTLREKNWLSGLPWPPFLKSSPAAPFLRDYLADQVGMSPASDLIVTPTPVLNPFSVNGQYPRSFNPQAMSSEEEEVFADLSSFQCVYLTLRNLVLSLWAQNCKDLLTAEKCSSHVICHGLVRIRLVKELPFIVDYLTTRGFINTGVIQDIPTGGLYPEQFNQKSIVVVGAGMAGLTAARQLHNWGAKVMLLEASPCIGGRIDDRHDLGMCVGEGAQMLNSSTNNPLLVLLEQTGATTVPLNERCPLFTTSGQRVDEDQDHLIEAHFNFLLERLSKWQTKGPTKDCSLLDKILHIHKNTAVGKVFTEEHKKLLAFYMSNLEYACGCPLSELSALQWDHTERLLQFNGPSCFVSRGFGSVLEQMAEGLNIRCDHQVDEIDYTADKIKVSVTGGKFYEADQVIVTVSLRILQTKTLAFKPSLPETKSDAIQNLGAGIIEKVALKFPNRFWPPTCPTFGCVPENTEERGMFNVFYDVTECDDVKDGVVLLTYLTGCAVDAVKNLTDVEIVQRCVETLRKMFPDEVVPNPISNFVSHWQDNEHVGMAFSYVPKGSSGDLYNLVEESIEGRILFAGEATNRQFPQSVTGAYLSGLKAAENIFVKR